MTGRVPLRISRRSSGLAKKPQGLPEELKVSFIPPLSGALFYLHCLGVGLSGFVGNIHYQGSEISYVIHRPPHRRQHHV